VHGMQSALSTLRDNGVLDERAVTSFAERQRLGWTSRHMTVWRPATWCMQCRRDADITLPINAHDPLRSSLTCKMMRGAADRPR
jgi:hypothetical protein